MVLSKREKYIAIGVGAALALFALDSVVLTPYFSKLEAIGKQRREIAVAQKQAADLRDKQRKLTPVWEEIRRGGMKASTSEAESQARRAILAWAQSSNAFITALNPDRTTAVGKFQVVSLNATANGGLPQMAHLLWSMETATIPVRLNEITITPRREGTDDLQIKFVVSTLCLPPDTATPQQQNRPSPAPAAAAPAVGESSVAMNWERP